MVCSASCVCVCVDVCVCVHHFFVHALSIMKLIGTKPARPNLLEITYTNNTSNNYATMLIPCRSVPRYQNRHELPCALQCHHCLPPSPLSQDQIAAHYCNGHYYCVCDGNHFVMRYALVLKIHYVDLNYHRRSLQQNCLVVRHRLHPLAAVAVRPQNVTLTVIYLV